MFAATPKRRSNNYPEALALVALRPSLIAVSRTLALNVRKLIHKLARPHPGDHPLPTCTDHSRVGTWQGASSNCRRFVVIAFHGGAANRFALGVLLLLFADSTPYQTRVSLANVEDCRVWGDRDNRATSAQNYRVRFFQVNIPPLRCVFTLAILNIDVVHTVGWLMVLARLY